MGLVREEERLNVSSHEDVDIDLVGDNEGQETGDLGGESFTHKLGEDENSMTWHIKIQN